MQSRLFGVDFQATITAYDTASAIIGSVSVNGINQQVTGTVPVLGATSPKPITKLVLTSPSIAYPDINMLVFGTIYFNPGMSVCTLVRPLCDA
jgi:hypothetical protein